MTGAELAMLCDRIPARRQLVVNTTSASGGSIAALEKPGRAVVTATKSGTEKNATVFARYWVEALHDPSADADKNESITALEAFQYADRKTAEFYESQKRLATEHAVFEDTGKGEAVCKRRSRLRPARKTKGHCVSRALLVGADGQRLERCQRSGQARLARQKRRAGAED